MNNKPNSITITPEQIIAAAQKIADSQFENGSWEHTAEEYVAATEHWLRIRINELLTEAAHYANQSNISGNFDLNLSCETRRRNLNDGLWYRCENPALPHSPYCEMHDHYSEAGGAIELVMPSPPEWAHEPVKSPTGWNEDSRFYGIE